MTILEEISRAARELARAGRWESALRLLDAADPDDPRIALAALEVAVESDLFGRTAIAAGRLAVAERVCGPVWPVEFQRLRIIYFGQLFRDGVFQFGPDGMDPDVLVALDRRAGELAAGAPDPVSAGWARMYHGLILDNLVADRAAAPEHYSAALAAGESGRDDLLTREALRHLGDHDRDDGNLTRARERWERATTLGARAGLVCGTLSQQILLAVLSRDTGDEAGALRLATEISRWAGAIGAKGLHAQAEALIAGERVAGESPRRREAPSTRGRAGPR